MNRRPGQIEVVTEVGYCPSCGRTRNLRRERHHLGQLVRTIVTCESCHRTLSSSIGVATAEPIKAEPAPAPVPAPAPAPVPAVRSTASAAKPVKKAAPVKKKATPAKKPVAKKPTGKPTSTATRKTTRRK